MLRIWQSGKKAGVARSVRPSPFITRTCFPRRVDLRARNNWGTRNRQDGSHADAVWSELGDSGIELEQAAESVATVNGPALGTWGTSRERKRRRLSLSCSFNARRREVSPNRMSFDRHSWRREHTQRSEKGFRFGL